MPDDDSTNIQFSRNDLIVATVHTLEKLPTHYSKKSELDYYVYLHLKIHLKKSDRQFLMKNIRGIISALVYATIIHPYHAKNHRYCLAENYQSKLELILNREGGNELYCDSNNHIARPAWARIQRNISPSLTENRAIHTISNDSTGFTNPASNQAEKHDVIVENNSLREMNTSKKGVYTDSPNAAAKPDSGNKQFSRMVLIHAIVETLETRRTHTCQLSSLCKLVCRNLKIQNSSRQITPIILSLMHANVIKRLGSTKMTLYQLSKDYQANLNKLIGKHDCEIVYFNTQDHSATTKMPSSNPRLPNPKEYKLEVELEVDDFPQVKNKLPDLPDLVDISFYEDDQDEDDWDEDDQENEDFDESDIDPLDILTGKPTNDPRTNQLPTPTTHISTDDFTFKDLRSIIASYIENHPDFESDTVRNKIQMITCMEDINIFITIAIDRHTSQVAFRAELQNLEVSLEDILDASAEDKFNCIPGRIKSNNHPLIQLRRLIPLLHIDSSRIFEAIDDIVDDSETLIELRRSGS